MLHENEIKAIFSLLESEPTRREQLLKSLSAFYNQNPRKIYTLALEYYGVLPIFLKDFFKTSANNLDGEIRYLLNLKNPSLLDILVLLAKIINPQNTKEQICALFDVAREDFDKIIDSSFEISQKAQILKTFFFETMSFKVESSIKQTAFFNLPEIFKNQKTTPLVMAVIYLIFIYPCEVKADIIEGENKFIVRLRDSFSLEPVYVDICNKGDFVGEDECDMYAAGNFIKWDSKNIIPLTPNQIIKQVLKDLSLTSPNFNFLSLYFD